MFLNLGGRLEDRNGAADDGRGQDDRKTQRAGNDRRFTEKAIEAFHLRNRTGLTLPLGARTVARRWNRSRFEKRASGFQNSERMRTRAQRYTKIGDGIDSVMKVLDLSPSSVWDGIKPALGNGAADSAMTKVAKSVGRSATDLPFLSDALSVASYGLDVSKDRFARRANRAVSRHGRG